MIIKNQSISVIVPVYNEIGNIMEFHKVLLHAMKETKKPYEIIYVDDHSTDGTYQWLLRRRKYVSKNNKFRHISPSALTNAIRVFRKKGKQGKAYSLKEGFDQANGSLFVMIDGDMQYSPNAIPGMIATLKSSQADIVVADRIHYKTSKLRKFITHGFRQVFGKFLFGLKTDIQSGLKVFTREVYRTVAFTPQSPWTFDLEFLHRARHAGFMIKNYDITFTERKHGESKMNVLNQIFEIGFNALYVRMVKLRPFAIPPTEDRNMAGAGIGHKNKKYITHTTLPFSLSAIQTFSLGQKLIIWFMVLAIVGGLLFRLIPTLQILVALLSILYFLDTVFNFFMVMRSLRKREEISITHSELENLSDSSLPVYSILCPLYKEAHVVPQFVKAIESLEWPKEKLDVMLLLEEDDIDTIATINQMQLPSYIRKVVVPHSMPKTKPKACNYGLNFAQGEYLVIYDAEDIPDADQLKKAYIAFQKAPDNVKCLQAKLNFYNARQNWLTRFFTAEYSLWFDLTLTGLQSFNSTIPLGGTSNHFRTQNLRELQGWDPFNVTEDADLGIRLFQKGFRTAIIDSTTLEEATSKTHNWLRQRSRWIKGYMQTYLVHMRNIHIFLREKGLWHNIIFQMTVGGKILFILINPWMWLITITYFSLYVYAAPFIEAVYVPPISYLAVFSWIFGNFLFLYYYMIGIGRRNDWDIMKYVFIIPYYWGLMSIAAAYALYQLIFKPHYWEKTVHGFHLAKPPVVKVSVPILTTEIPPTVPTPAYAQPGIFGKSFHYLSSGFASQKLVIIAFVILLVQIPLIAWYYNAINDFLKTLFLLTALDIAALSVFQLKVNFKSIFKNNFDSIINLFKKPSREKAWQEKRLRILVFNWRDTKHIYNGGAEVYVQELAKRWVLDGNKVTIFCGNDNRNRMTETVDGVEIIRCGGTYTVYLFAVLYYLYKLRGKYDVIIDCENGIPFFTPLYVRKPVILLIHHVHQEVFRTFLKYPVNIFAAFLEGKLMPLVYRNKSIVTVSPSSQEEILKLGFTHSGKIDIVHNGVQELNTTGYEKTPYPSFTYVGRLKEYKNIDVAIKAFSQVLKDLPLSKLFIAGYGESFPQLLALTKQLGIEQQVEFLGKITHEQKVQLMAESWMLVQPSQIEGWGITVLEANAAGTPVIASRVNGLKDAVLDGETGLLVESGNVDAFALGMKRLAVDREYRIRLSQAATEWAKNFQWDRSAQRFYMVIGRSISEKLYQPAYSDLVIPTINK